jgi:hypothetical protein
VAGGGAACIGTVIARVAAGASIGISITGRSGTCTIGCGVTTSTGGSSRFGVGSARETNSLADLGREGECHVQHERVHGADGDSDIQSRMIFCEHGSSRARKFAYPSNDGAIMPWDNLGCK